jgi:hypothetical protein
VGIVGTGQRLSVDPAARAAGGPRSDAAGAAVGGSDGEEVFDGAARAHAGDAAGGGIPLVNALEISNAAMTNRYLAGEIGEVTRRVREGQALRRRCWRGPCFRTSRSRWWKWASQPVRCRRC